MHPAAPLSLVLLACSTAFAEEPAAKSDERQTDFRLRPYVGNTFDSDLKTGGGKSSVFRTGLNLDVGIPIGQRATMNIGLNGEYSKYHFSDATAFGIGGPEPISSTFEYQASLRYSREIDDKWSFFVVGAINAAGANGADFSESLTYGGGGGASYKVNDKFDVGLGIVVRSSLEDDTFVMPVPLINWQISEQWEFTTRYRNIRVNFKPADQWELFATVDYITHEYRLDEDAGASKGVFRDHAVPISIGATFSPSRKFSITAGAGVNVWRELTLDDQFGNRIAETETDPSLNLFVSATIAF